MALHKFTPGGCRQNCETSGCCPSGTCTDGRSYTEYTLKVYRNGVLQATYTLPHNAAESSGSTCAFVSLSADAGICGEASGWGLLTFGVASGQTTYSVALYSSDPLANNPQLQLTAPGVALGSAPQDCTQTLTGTFTIFSAACNGYTWTYQIEPSGTLCTAAATNSCCPCEDCRLMRDNFNRAAGTDLGANWTETAGSWEIVDPSWAKVASANALLLSASSASQVGVKLLCVAKAGADGDKLRVLVCYQSANDYVFAEWVCGPTGTFTLYRRSGGTDTEIASGAVSTSANTATTLTVCVSSDGTEAAARLIQGGASGSLSMLGGAIATAAAGKYGLATGGTASDARFTRVELSKTSAGCENCAQEIPCYHCSTPSRVAYVDFGANPFSGSARDCCADFGGQYELEQYLTLTGCPACPWTPYNSDITQIEPQLGCLWVFTNDDCGAEFDAGTTFIAAFLYWGEYNSAASANKLWWIVYARTESAYAWYRLEVTSQQITPGAAPGTEGSYLSDCQQTWTLALDSSRSSGTWCGGSWPATITLEMPTP